jgi:HEPN domain-containing protein
MAENDSRLNSSAQWFHYADADMRAAKLLRNAEEHPAACFHAQQAVEKSFKGLLSIVGDVKKSHSISEMLKIVKDSGYDANGIIPPAGKLDRYYIATRYPDALPGSNAQDVFDIQDANDAIGIAEQTIKLLSEWAAAAGVQIDHK